MNPVITQTPGTVYNLAEVLRQWGLPKTMTDGIAPEWECEIVERPNTPEEMARLMAEGRPFAAPKTLAAAAYDAVGSNALSFVRQTVE